MGASEPAGIANDRDSYRRLTSSTLATRDRRTRRLSIFDYAHLHDSSATCDLGTQRPACLFRDPVFKDSLLNFVESGNPTLYSLVNPDQVCAESGLDGAHPAKRSFVFDGCRKGGAEPRHDSIRRGGVESMTREDGIGQRHGSPGFDASFGEFEE